MTTTHPDLTQTTPDPRPNPTETATNLHSAITHHPETDRTSTMKPIPAPAQILATEHKQDGAVNLV